MKNFPFSMGEAHLPPNNASQSDVAPKKLARQLHFTAPPPPFSTLLKPESPKSRTRPLELKRQCHCKYSRCLKLYCDCFASGIYCDGCNCLNCYNSIDNEASRREAYEATLKRNPNAFRPKIASSPQGTRDRREETAEGLVWTKHNKACHCKKIGCLKKYCDCFRANILCSENCKCIDCKNFGGSEKRRAIFHGDHANAAISGAVGHYQQAAHVRPSASSSSSSNNSSALIGSTTAVGPSKFTYRSLLADIIHPHDLKELCSVLVVMTAEVAKTLADEKNTEDMRLQDQTETALVSSTQQRLLSRKGTDAWNVDDDCSSANQADKTGTDDSSSDGADLPKARPMSPGTLELLCDQRDTIFMGAASPSCSLGYGCNTTLQLPCGQGMEEIYAEQERIVLLKFRDCLNRLITFGKIKETNCSSFARTELGNQRDGTTPTRPEARNQQRPISNGVAEHLQPAVRTSPRVPPLPQNGDGTSQEHSCRNKTRYDAEEKMDIQVKNDGVPEFKPFSSGIKSLP